MVFYMRHIIHLAIILCLSIVSAQMGFANEQNEKSKEEIERLVEQAKKKFPNLDDYVIRYAIERDMKPDVVDALLKEVEKEKFEIFEDYDMEIAYDTHETCKVSSYSNFYHCPCTAVNFVEALRQNGGEGIALNILVNSKRNCPFVESVANMSYGECMGGMSLMNISGNLDEEKYCTCYANTYAKMFERKASTARVDRYNMRSKAYSFCSKNYKTMDISIE